MRLIAHAELKSEYGVPYSSEHLRRLEKVGKFPQRVPGRRIWVESEIAEWVEAWAARRNPTTKYEQSETSETPFKNDRPEGDTEPRARGEALTDGLYEESATKQGRNGKFQSRAFKTKGAT